MDLTEPEVRVLGALIEKERTTPEQYPLTTNALVAACNQRTSRHPVTDYDERSVDDAMRELRQRGLARTVRGSGMRTYKHRHVADEALGLDRGELAVLAVLALRGPQTPGELRARTERFGTGGDVERALVALADRGEPLAVNLGRAPGQSQDRWAHLLSGSEAARTATAEPAGGSAAPGGARSPSSGRVDELVQRIDQLEARLARLEAELGLQGDGEAAAS